MAVNNRSLSQSQQKFPLNWSTGNLALTTGETGVIGFIPFPCVLSAANVAALDVVGSPDLMITINRFIPGTGVTVFALGTTFVPPKYGTSGVLTSGLSLLAAGNTLLNLMPNDVLGYQVGGGSTTGIFGLGGCFVLQPIQDIRVYLNNLA